MGSRSEYAGLIDKWKSKVLEKARYTCQECGAFGGPLDAHHIVSWVKSIHGRFDPDNGAALCPLCHGRKHGHSNGFIRCKKESDMNSSYISLKRTAVSIANDQHQKLKILALATGRTIQQVVNSAIDTYLTTPSSNPRIKEAQAEIEKVLAEYRQPREIKKERLWKN